MTDRVYIIGAGAIGKALAVFLTNEGRKVTLIKARDTHESKGVEDLRVEMNDGTTLSAPVPLSELDAHAELNGVIVLANKSNGNTGLAAKLKAVAGSSPIVLLQNGLDVEQPFIDAGLPNIFRCVLFSTSQVLHSAAVRFKPVAPSPIGQVRGDASLVQRIVDLLNSKYFLFKVENDIQSVTWKKVIANCVFNSICPMLDVDNGIFHRNATAKIMAQEIIDECVAVAVRLGIPLQGEEVLQTVLQISKASDGQSISTLQDIRNNRPTEIDSLNFAIVRKASALGMSHQVARTKLLGELTKLKSDIGMGG